MKNQELHNLAEMLSDLVSDIEKLVSDEIKEGSLMQSVIEDMNTEQLSKGVGGNGQILPEYSECSVECYGKTPGAMTMKDTGEFYSSIEMKPKKTSFQFISESPKMKPPIRLEYNYGKLLGLTKKSQKELSEDYLVPEIKKFIKTKINEN